MAKRRRQKEMEERLRFHQEFTESAASNPGQLEVNWARYIQCFPLWPITFFASAFVFFVLASRVHWGFWVLVAIALFLLWAWWFRTRMQFVGGCINPGKVVSLYPPLIAVYTDLTKGGGVSYPVVKVLKHPFGRMYDGPYEEGDSIAAIAVYQPSNDEEQPHWDDFYPIAVQCATTDSDEVDRIYESLDEESWATLDNALKQVPQPFEPGLYRIRQRGRRSH